MKTFLSTAVLLAVASFAPAQRPPQAPPLAFGITVGGQGLGIDAATKTVTLPPDWKVVVQAPTVKTTLVPVPAPAPAVAAVPFAITPVTGPVTTVLPAAGVSTSRSVGFQAGFTRTAAAPTVQFGGITTVSGGCANGQCGVPADGFGAPRLFAPFGGRFRLPR